VQESHGERMQLVVVVEEARESINQLQQELEESRGTISDLTMHVGTGGGISTPSRLRKCVGAF